MSNADTLALDGLIAAVNTAPGHAPTGSRLCAVRDQTNERTPAMTKTNIKVVAANEAAINAAIAAVEGRAHARCLGYHSLVRMVTAAEKALKATGLPVKHWPGARYAYSEGGLMGAARCYQGYHRASTLAVIERRSRHWHLIAASRPDWYKGEAGPDHLVLTPEQRDEVVRRFAQSIRTYTPEPVAPPKAPRDGLDIPPGAREVTADMLADLPLPSGMRRAA